MTENLISAEGPWEALNAKGVQTEVDAGYEGKDQIVLVEAKNTKKDNIIIRQLFYPFRHWKAHTSKKVRTIFFERRGSTYCMWEFAFKDELDYHSISFVRSASYKIVE